MELVMFIVGLILGGAVATIIMCCLQINRINEYQRETDKLKKQLNKTH